MGHHRLCSAAGAHFPWTVQQMDLFGKIDQVLISPSIFESTTSRHNSWGLASPSDYVSEHDEFPTFRECDRPGHWDLCSTE